MSFHNLTNNEIDKSVVKEMNSLGLQGWELVSVAPARCQRQFDDPEYLLTAFFKREINK